MKYVVILILIGLLFLLFVPYMLADYIKPLQKFFCKIGWHCHQKDYITENFDNIGYVLEEVLQDDECFSLKDLAVNGKDLITIGYKPGKEIGEVLNNLLDSVISGEYINEKEKLLEIAERRLQDIYI